MLKEFKEFAVKGNMLDLAIGVIIGGAFGKIVSSLVEDILMPLLTLLTGGMDSFSNLSVTIGNATVKYGLFIQNIIDFLIVAFAIFIMVKQLNRFKKKEEVVKEETKVKECVYCKSEIAIEATRCPHCTSVLE